MHGSTTLGNRWTIFAGIENDTLAISALLNVLYGARQKVAHPLINHTAEQECVPVCKFNQLSNPFDGVGNFLTRAIVHGIKFERCGNDRGKI